MVTDETEGHRRDDVVSPHAAAWMSQDRLDRDSTTCESSSALRSDNLLLLTTRTTPIGVIGPNRRTAMLSQAALRSGGTGARTRARANEPVGPVNVGASTCNSVGLGMMATADDEIRQCVPYRCYGESRIRMWRTCVYSVAPSRLRRHINWTSYDMSDTQFGAHTRLRRRTFNGALC